MRKLYTLALLSSLSSLSLFATGAAGCDGVSGSGCGAWWNNYTLGTGTDGIFAQSTGVALAYTANFTTVAASQDPVSATFPWITSTSSTALSTNNTTSSASFGSLMTTFTSTVSTNNTSSSSASSYGSLLTSFTPSFTNNVASFLPTNTGGTTTSSLFSDGGTSSYSSYLAQIYALAYASPSGPVTTIAVNNPIFGLAETPEPSTYVSMGIGLAMVLGYARKRRLSKKV